MKISERISIALKRSHKSQRELAKHMNVSSSAVNRMLGDGIEKEIDSVKYIQAVEELTGYRFEWLRTGIGSERIEEGPPGDVQSLEFMRGILKSKDDLIKEQSGRIGDLQKLNNLLESRYLILESRYQEMKSSLEELQRKSSSDKVSSRKKKIGSTKPPKRDVRAKRTAK